MIDDKYKIEAPGSALLAIFFDKIKTWIKWRRQLENEFTENKLSNKVQTQF